MSRRKITTRRIVQIKPSHTTVINRGPDLLDYMANKIHPVLGVANDIIQSKGKPYAKIEKEPSELGQIISQQVEDVNKDVQEIIKKNVKVSTFHYPKVRKIRRYAYPVVPDPPKAPEPVEEENPYKDLVDEH